MATPQSPRLVHKAAVDDLYCELLDTFRGKEEPSEGQHYCQSVCKSCRVLCVSERRAASQ